MRKMIWWSPILLAILVGGALRAWPQNSSEQQSPEKQESACRLDFSLNELEDGKKINVRHYSMNLTGGAYKELKIGTRINVETETGKFQYLDVGTSIHSRIDGKPDWPILDVTAEISNFAVPDQGARGGANPLLRQMVISGSTLLLFDKPMVIGAVDDPNSKRQYQLEVTATKIK